MFQRNIFSIALALMILSVALYFLYPAIKSSPENDIEGANFFWTSVGGKSYNIKADYVMKTGPGRYKLTRVDGIYYLDSGRKNYVDLSADIALFNEEKNLMDLKGNVEFRSSQGYKAVSDSMYLDLNQKTARTDDKVTLSGMHANTVSPKGMLIYMGLKKILLYGPITSVFTSDTRPPIKVNAITVEADYSSNVVTYQGNVVARQADVFDLYCDRAVILYAQQRQYKYGIKQIQFFGKVKVVKGEKIATGEFGVLDPQNKVITLRGNVALKEKDTYLEGEDVHYNTETGVFTVNESQRVGAQQDRIRVILGSEKS